LISELAFFEAFGGAVEDRDVHEYIQMIEKIRRRILEYANASYKGPHRLTTHLKYHFSFYYPTLLVT
jgi:hypothetical protein